MARLAQALQVGPRVRPAICEWADMIDFFGADHLARREADAAARLLGSHLLAQSHAATTTQATVRAG